MKRIKLVTKESGGETPGSKLGNIRLLLQQRNRMPFSHRAERKRIPMSKFHHSNAVLRPPPLGRLLEAAAAPTAPL